jgi:transposase-like protein
MGKWKQVQKYAEHVPHPLLNYIKNRDSATHILLLDAIFVNVDGDGRAVMIAYDTGVGVIDYWIDYTENATGYSLIFQHLDKAGYKPICVVSDGHTGIQSVIDERNLPHQLCVFHLLRSLKRWLTDGNGFRKPKDHILYSRIKGVLKTGRIEDLPERINGFRYFESIFPGRKDVFKWFWKILPDAVIHLSYTEKVPNGTNLLENLNGQIRARLKTFRGVKSEKSLSNLLKILFHFRKCK